MANLQELSSNYTPLLIELSPVVSALKESANIGFKGEGIAVRGTNSSGEAWQVMAKNIADQRVGQSFDDGVILGCVELDTAEAVKKQVKGKTMPDLVLFIEKEGTIQLVPIDFKSDLSYVNVNQISTDTLQSLMQHPAIKSVLQKKASELQVAIDSVQIESGKFMTPRTSEAEHTAKKNIPAWFIELDDEQKSTLREARPGHQIINLLRNIPWGNDNNSAQDKATPDEKERFLELYASAIWNLVSVMTADATGRRLSSETVEQTCTSLIESYKSDPTVTLRSIRKALEPIAEKKVKEVTEVIDTAVNDKMLTKIVGDLIKELGWLIRQNSDYAQKFISITQVNEIAAQNRERVAEKYFERIRAADPAQRTSSMNDTSWIAPYIRDSVMTQLTELHPQDPQPNSNE